MEWNNELTLEFLEAYEKHPVLWNSLYPGHKNKNTLQDAWTEVANELSVTMPVVALKKKKESLMSTYRTLRKKIVDSETTGSGSQDVYYPSWFAYNAIDRFIRVQNTKIPSLNSEDVADGKINEIEDLMQNEGDLDHSNLEEDDLEASSLGDNGIQNERRENTQENRNMFSVPQSPLMKRKQRSVDNSQLISKHLKQASDVLQGLVKKPNSQQNKDGPDLYAQLLAEKLRQLSPRNRLLLEHKIDNMVFEALIQEMDSKTEGHFPITINTVSSPCSSLESFLSTGSTYSTHELQSPGTSYTPHLTANHEYIQPSQSQQQNKYIQPSQSQQQNEYIQSSQSQQQNEYIQPSQSQQQNKYIQPSQSQQQNEYIQPSQSQQQNVTGPQTQSGTVLEFYSNSQQFVDGNQTGGK